MKDLTLPAWEQFLSKFERGVMRPNRYEIEFNLPKGIVSTSGGELIDKRAVFGVIQLQSGQLNAGGRINVKCHTATVPQRTLQSFTIKQNITPFSVPYSAVYDPVTFSFYADANGDTRKFFDIWQRTAINVKSNTTNFYDEYTSDVVMKILDRENIPSYAVRLYGAYPISVGPLELSYASNDAFQTIMTTMSYRYWEEVSL